MSDIQPLFQGEVQLASWSETHHGGAKVTLWLADPDELAAFKALTLRAGGKAGQRLACVLVPIGDDEQPKAPPPVAREHTGLAQELHVRGYFRDRRLWQCLHDAGVYTVEQHREWIQQQPCIARKRSACDGDVVLHHARAAHLAAAGKHLQPRNPAKLPHWYGVPLCHAHHMGWVHANATAEDHQWLLERAVGLMAKQAHAAFRSLAGLQSLAELTEEIKREVEAQIGFAAA